MSNEHLCEEIERLWAEECVRRDTELDEGTASMRDAEDVFRDARDLLLCVKSGLVTDSIKSAP